MTLEIEGCGRVAFELWDCEKASIAILGERNWPEQAKVKVCKIGK